MADAGFTSQQVTEITGVTHRQLAYWRKTGLIEPSGKTGGGHARYAFTDLIALKTAKQLLDAGVSLQRLRSSLSALLRYLPTVPRPLTHLSLVATGDVVLVFHQGTAFEALSGQEWVFPIAQFQREVERWRSGAPPVQGELFEKWPQEFETPSPVRKVRR